MRRNPRALHAARSLVRLFRTSAAIAGLASATAFANACSSSSGGSSDAGSPDTSPGDTSTADAPPTVADGSTLDQSVPVDAGGGDASSDASVADSAAADDGGDADASADADGGGPGDGAPTLLQSAGSGNDVLVVEGITNDGYVVYYDGSNRTYYAKPEDGGASRALYSLSPELSGYTWVLGNELFVFAVASNYVGQLSAWSSAMTLPLTLSTSAVVRYVATAWAAPDAAHLAFVQVGASANVGTIYGVNGDGSHQTLLVSNVDVSLAGQDGPCLPRVAFSGDYAVVSYCTMTDGGEAPALQAFSTSHGWAPTLDVPNLVLLNLLGVNPYVEAPFVVDPAGGRVAAASGTAMGDAGAGALQAFALDGGAGVVVDPNAGLTTASFIRTAATAPWSLLYTESSGALLRSPVDSPVPVVIADGGVNDIESVSSDGRWAVTATATGNDLGLLDTSAPGVVKPLATASGYDNLSVSTEVLPSAAFTGDDGFVLFRTDLANLYPGATYYVRSAPVASPGQSQLLSNGYAIDAIPLSGSNVLLYDNYQTYDGGAAPTVDLSLLNLDAGVRTGAVATTVPILTGSFLPYGTGGIVVSNDLTKIVYPVVTGPAPGIYIANLPH